MITYKIPVNLVRHLVFLNFQSEFISKVKVKVNMDLYSALSWTHH